MSSSLTSSLAAHFSAHEGQWIDGRHLAEIAGSYAWRTRVSDLRRAPYLMRIENRQRRVARDDGEHYTVSEYRYVQSRTGHVRRTTSDVSETDRPSLWGEGRS